MRKHKMRAVYKLLATVRFPLMFHDHYWPLHFRGKDDDEDENGDLQPEAKSGDRAVSKAFALGSRTAV